MSNAARIAEFVATSTTPTQIDPATPLNHATRMAAMVQLWLTAKGIMRPATHQDAHDMQVEIEEQAQEEASAKQNEGAVSPPPVASQSPTPSQVADAQKAAFAEDDARIAKIIEDSKAQPVAETTKKPLDMPVRPLSKFRFVNEATRMKEVVLPDPFYGEEPDGSEYLYEKIILRKPTGREIRDYFRDQQAAIPTQVPVYFRADGKPFPVELIDDVFDIDLQQDITKAAESFLPSFFRSAEEPNAPQ